MGRRPGVGAGSAVGDAADRPRAGTPFELYGGDLPGIEAHLDHVERLGANVIYLTPVFPASSSHRYDASSFDRVDPLLGGDEALVSLARAAHDRGLRVLGDLTLNHCGAQHEWFVRAQEDPASPERGLFYFDDALPNGYESWLGHPQPAEARLGLARASAPHARSLAAGSSRRTRSTGGVSTSRTWSAATASWRSRRRLPPWRASAVADKLLVAEHGHDFREDLHGDGWHGTMNYAGFLRPAWTWLRGPTIARGARPLFWGIPVGLPRLGGTATVETMRSFRAGLPWDRVLHSWTLLDSHDTARFRSVAGSRERHVVGIGLQMTTPGVPMVFAGDELGLEGDWGEDGRRTMPWDEPGAWDAALLEEYRRSSRCAARSARSPTAGSATSHVGDDAIAYLRESRAGRLLASRARSARPDRLDDARRGSRRSSAATRRDGEPSFPPTARRSTPGLT